MAKVQPEEKEAEDSAGLVSSHGNLVGHLDSVLCCFAAKFAVLFIVLLVLLC